MMSKTLVLVAGILGLVNQSSAQIGFGSVPSERPVVICNLAQQVKPTDEAAKILNGNGQSYRCSFAGKEYQTSFVGVDLKLAAAKVAGSKLILSIQCTTDSPVGIYVFGGYPVGFQTNSFKRIPWFYNPNPKAPGARCHLIGDSVVSKLLSATVNKSAMVILPVKNALN